MAGYLPGRLLPELLRSFTSFMMRACQALEKLSKMNRMDPNVMTLLVLASGFFLICKMP